MWFRPLSFLLVPFSAASLMGCPATEPTDPLEEQACPDWSTMTGGEVVADLDGEAWTMTRANYRLEDGLIAVSGTAGQVTLEIRFRESREGYSAEEVFNGTFPATFDIVEDSNDAGAWALVYHGVAYHSSHDSGWFRFEERDGSDRLSGCFEFDVNASGVAGEHVFTDGLFRFRLNEAG